MSFSILTVWAEPGAIGEYCLKGVEVTSPDIHVPIRNHACQILTHALPHDAGFPVIHDETLFEQNCSNVR